VEIEKLVGLIEPDSLKVHANEQPSVLPNPELTVDLLDSCRLHEHSEDALMMASGGRWSSAYDLEKCKMFENIDSVLYEVPTNSPEVPDTYNMHRWGVAVDLRADRQNGIILPRCTDVEEGLADYVPMDLSKGYSHVGGLSRPGGRVQDWKFRVPGTHEPLTPRAYLRKNRYHANLNELVNILFEVVEFPQTVIGMCHMDPLEKEGPFTVNGYWMIDCSDYVFLE
jgi:hypothetical protein